MVAGGFAYINKFGCLGCEAEDALISQTVVDDYIGNFEGISGFQSGQSPVAGAGANEKYFSGHDLPPYI